jgi:AcrR family transcriptional regulator
MDSDSVPVEAHSTSALALIYAAEMLFAKHGIASVSLRQINQTANHKNIAAAHYHFGSRDGLVKAVLHHRWHRLDRRRRELLQRRNVRRDLRFYLECFIEPMAEELAPRPEGNHYLRFVQQYESYVGDYEFARRFSPVGVEIYECIEHLIAYIPHKILSLRMGYLINIVHSVLAKAEHRIERGEASFRDVPLTYCNLVDMVAAALMAPLSSETLEVAESGGETPSVRRRTSKVDSPN